MQSAALAVLAALTSVPDWQAATCGERIPQQAAEATTASVLEAAAQRLVVEATGAAVSSPQGSPALAHAAPSPFDEYLDACCSLAEDTLKRGREGVAAGVGAVGATHVLRGGTWDAPPGHARCGADGQKARGGGRTAGRFSDSPGDSSPLGSSPAGYGGPRPRGSKQHGGAACYQPAADALAEDCAAIGALREGLEDDCKRIGALRRAFSPVLGALAVCTADCFTFSRTASERTQLVDWLPCCWQAYCAWSFSFFIHIGCCVGA